MAVSAPGGAGSVPRASATARRRARQTVPRSVTYWYSSSTGSAVTASASNAARARSIEVGDGGGHRPQRTTTARIAGRGPEAGRGGGPSRRWRRTGDVGAAGDRGSDRLAAPGQRRLRRRAGWRPAGLGLALELAQRPQAAPVPAGGVGPRCALRRISYAARRSPARSSRPTPSSTSRTARAGPRRDSGRPSGEACPRRPARYGRVSCRGFAGSPGAVARAHRRDGLGGLRGRQRRSTARSAVAPAPVSRPGGPRSRCGSRAPMPRAAPSA